MAATDELRRLLDERGVRWDYGISGSRSTEFMVNGRDLCFDEYRHGMLCTTILTPEQVVDVTVGGTCHAVHMDCFGNPPYNTSGLHGNDTACGCSECGVPWSTMGIFRGNQLKHNFKACPLCGRRVVE